MPPASSLRLLCTGDLHLGRYPARVPSGRRTLSVEHVWERIVEYAATQQVDALLLTGDVVDRDNRFYEAFGPLQRGLQRLAEVGVPTYAVAGNHDHDVLPNLARLLDGDHFYLLGAGGRWETAPLLRDGAPVLYLAGWSFPRQHVTDTPLANLPQIDGEVPTLGLLHADLDQDGSRYAPVRTRDLRAVPVASWLLGHLHRPQCRDHRNGVLLYPGSPQPLDPGEQEAHGPWLLTVETDGRVEAEPLPLATVCYATCDVDLEGVEDEDGFRERVVEALRDDLERRCGEQETLEHTAYRLRYTGRTALHRHVDGYSASVTADLRVPVARAEARVHATELATTPAFDLAALAEADDPPGVLARLLLDLQEGDASGHADLVREVSGALRSVHRANAYAPLLQEASTRERPGADDVRRLVLRQGLLLLDAMMAQKT